MKCSECHYWWIDEGDEYPSCHFDETIHPTPAPCEEEDYYEEE